MSKLYECKFSRFFICLCLIICIGLASFCISVDKADALVINPWTIALCGSLLVAAGLSFNTAQQMESAVSSFAGSCDSSLWDSLVSKAESFKDEYGTGFHFPITEAIVSAISGWLSGLKSDDEALLTFEGFYTFNPYDFPVGETVIASYPISKFLVKKPASPDKSFAFFAFPYLGFYLYEYGSSYSCYHFYDLPDGRSFNLNSSIYSIQDTVDLVLKVSSYEGKISYSMSYKFPDATKVICGHGFDLTSISVSTSCSIPFDDVWAPGSSVSEKELTAGCDVAVPGGIINTDGVLESDVVAGMSASNVRANSGTNTDADVVAGTGTITGSGSGTGIFEGVGAFDLVFGIPILGDILKAILTGFELLAGLISSVFSSPIEWLKELLTSIWNAITSGFEAVLNWGSSLFDSISQFFKDCLQFLKDILAALADFLTGIVAFIPDILAWLASYALFSDLLNKFLPQPVAVVFISFFLATIAIWLFRMIANR